MSHIKTLGDLRNILTQFPNTDEYNKMPLVYAIDDEGNGYRFTSYLPGICDIAISNTNQYRVQYIHSDDSPDDYDIEDSTITKGILMN